MRYFLLLSFFSVLVGGCSDAASPGADSSPDAAEALPVYHLDAPEPTIDIEPSTTIDKLAENYIKAYNAGATGTIMNELIYWGDHELDDELRAHTKASLCLFAGEYKAGEREIVDANSYYDDGSYYKHREERYSIESPDLMKFTLTHPTISARTGVIAPFGRIGDRYYFGALIDDDTTD
jgi:hypothetical protein